MTTKQLLFREAARDKIRKGVDALADAVKVILGPRGRTVIIDQESGAPQIVNSGVIVARSLATTRPRASMATCSRWASLTRSR